MDHLVCPRCGPPFGLILLADEVRDRNVVEGTLGCPNCRDRYPVSDGFADLRSAPRKPLAPAAQSHAPAPMEIAAALGVTSGPAILVLVGSATRSSVGVADLVPESQIVSVGPPLGKGADRVTQLVARPRLPFHDQAIRGLALDEADVSTWGGEAARVLVPGSRMVVFGSPNEDSSSEVLDGLDRAGFDAQRAAPGVHVGVRRPAKVSQSS